MFGQTKQASSAKAALFYLTIGSLLIVWTVVYYFYLRATDGDFVRFLWCGGFFFTGLALLIIGLAVGRIGRAAMPAETAATPAVAVVPNNGTDTVSTTPIMTNPAGEGVPVASGATVPKSPVVPAEVVRRH